MEDWQPRFKEEIFIQMGQRGRDRELGQEYMVWCPRQQGQWGSCCLRNGWSHIPSLQIKPQRDNWELSNPSPRPDLAAHGSNWPQDWQELFKVLKSKNLHPRLLYQAKLSFRIKGQIKCSPNKVKLKEFIITKLLLHKMFKGPIQEKEEDQNYEHWNGNKFTTINNWI